MEPEWKLHLCTNFQEENQCKIVFSVLTLKAPSKFAAEYIHNCFFKFLEKIRLEFSCEIYMALFSLSSAFSFFISEFSLFHFSEEMQYNHIITKIT